jgi:hypothetical protein
MSDRLPIIKTVCSEDFSPSIVRTKVLTTNESYWARSIGHDLRRLLPIFSVKCGVKTDF